MAISRQHRGIRPLVIDRAGEVASSWRTRYDRLKLNTGRQFSHLPGRSYPWFIGFSARPALIAFVGKQSRRLAKKIANG